MQCTATTLRGTQCRHRAQPGTEVCHLHTGTACSICFGPMSAATSRVLPCEHMFHTRCIERWKRTANTCPMCRAPFDQPQYKVNVSIQRLADNHTFQESYVTSDISALVDAFGVPLPQPRFITDIFFDVGFDEFINDVFREIGIRLPTSFSAQANGSANFEAGNAPLPGSAAEPPSQPQI